MGNIRSDGEDFSLVGVDYFASRLTNIFNVTKTSIAIDEGCVTSKVDFSLKNSAPLLDSGNNEGFDLRHVENSAPGPLLSILRSAQSIFLSSSDSLEKRFWNAAKSLLIVARTSVCFFGASICELLPVIMVLLVLLIAMRLVILYDIQEQIKVRRERCSLKGLYRLRKKKWIEKWEKKQCCIRKTDSEKDENKKQNRELTPLRKRWSAIFIIFNLFMHTATAHVQFDYQNQQNRRGERQQQGQHQENYIDPSLGESASKEFHSAPRQEQTKLNGRPLSSAPPPFHGVEASEHRLESVSTKPFVSSELWANKKMAGSSTEMSSSTREPTREPTPSPTSWTYGK